MLTNADFPVPNTMISLSRFSAWESGYHWVISVLVGTEVSPSHKSAHLLGFGNWSYLYCFLMRVCILQSSFVKYVVEWACACVFINLAQRRPSSHTPHGQPYLQHPLPSRDFFTEAQVIKVCTQYCESNSSFSKMLPLFTFCTDFTAVGPRILSSYISDTDSCVQHLCSASKITFKGEQTKVSALCL